MKPAALIVIAKAPRAGHSKTRLCPPCTPAQAAGLAGAALEDTLEAVAATRAARHICVLEGPAGPWLPPGFEVVAQVEGGLDRRLAAAFDAAAGPALLVGMDTPQVSMRDLEAAQAALAAPGCDAVFGPAIDGGYWAVGLRRPDPRVFEGVPMSTPWTLAAQRERLRMLGLKWGELATMRDVDTIEDARIVAGQDPGSRFAIAMRAIDPEAGRVAAAESRVGAT